MNRQSKEIEAPKVFVDIRKSHPLTGSYVTAHIPQTDISELISNSFEGGEFNDTPGIVVYKQAKAIIESSRLERAFKAALTESQEAGEAYRGAEENGRKIITFNKGQFAYVTYWAEGQVTVQRYAASLMGEIFLEEMEFAGYGMLYSTQLYRSKKNVGLQNFYKINDAVDDSIVVQRSEKVLSDIQS